MDFAWKSFIDPNPDANLRGVVGELRPSRYRTVPRVLRNTRRIESQLAESDGLVGYALRANFLRRRFCALAVWEDEESLQTFVTATPHAEVMAAFEEEMEVSRFDRFEVSGGEVPLGIDEAIARANPE